MKGITMPPVIQKQQSFNPFDEIMRDDKQEEEDDGFDEFKVAKLENATSTGSNVLSSTAPNPQPFPSLSDQ